MRIPMIEWLIIGATTIATGICLAVFYVHERTLMTINETLAEVRDFLVEASQEIVTRIESLEQELVAAKNAHQAPDIDADLLAEVKQWAQALADVVPDEEDLVVEDDVPVEVEEVVEPEEVVE
jgi:hypothetical protein